MSVRDLRNKGGDILDSLMRGATVTVTRQGRPIAELRPLRRGTDTVRLLEVWRGTPTFSLEGLRRDFAELSVGPLVATSNDERLARQSVLQVAEVHFSPLAFDAESARAFGRVAAALRGTDRKRRARTYDALIAAVGLRHDFPIYTCNPEDFTGITGLTVRTVPLSATVKP